MRQLELPAPQLQDLANASGLQIVAITDVSPPNQAEKRLIEWQLSGFAGEMEFMKREPALLSNPKRLLPEAKTMVLFSVFYKDFLSLFIDLEDRYLWVNPNPIPSFDRCTTTAHTLIKRMVF